MKICPECGNPVAYNSHFGAYICRCCGYEIAANKENKTSKYERLYNRAVKMNRNPVASWYATIAALSIDLEDAADAPVHINRTFELRNEVILTIDGENGEKDSHITIMPQFTECGELQIFYDTGKKINEALDKSSSNLEVARLPVTTEEILKLLHTEI